jgi:DNA-binding response OmpR family regulator
MQQTILIVEDDADIAEGLQYNLKREGFRIAIAESGEKGLRLALDEKNAPSLILLDLMLPGMTGMELCRRLRKETLTKKTPIIMLTAKAAEGEKILGLDTGADDYVVKPFSIKEVIARVRAVLRRSRAPLAVAPGIPVLVDADLVVDLVAHQARLGGRVLALTPREFELLAHLMRHPRRAFRREELLEEVWGYRYGDTSTVTVHVRRLREKVEAAPRRPVRIATVAGIGYRWEGVAAR